MLAGATPAAAQGRPACVTVANSANGWFPVELRTGEEKPIAFQADVGMPKSFCLPVAVKADQVIEVKVKSWMNPVGICQVRSGQRIDIVRIKPKGGGKEYNEVRCP
jgi:hypothetical protein